MTTVKETLAALVERVAKLEDRVEQLELERTRLRETLHVERLIVGTQRNRVYINEQGIVLGEGSLEVAPGGDIRLGDRAAPPVRIDQHGVRIKTDAAVYQLDYRGVRLEGTRDDGVYLDEAGIQLRERANLTVLTQHGPIIELNPQDGWLRLNDPQANTASSFGPDALSIERGDSSVTLSAESLAFERAGYAEQDYLRLSRGSIEGAHASASTFPGTQRFLLHGAELVVDSQLPNQSHRPWAAHLNQQRLQFREQGVPIATLP